MSRKGKLFFTDRKVAKLKKDLYTVYVKNNTSVERGLSMKKIKVSSAVDLTEGGCNACGTVKCVMYTLEIDGREIALENMTVNELVRALAIHEGWRQELVVEMLDEHVVYRKDSKQVKLEEEYDQLTFSQGSQRLVTRDFLEIPNEVTQKANEILTTFFDVDGYTFEMS